MLSNHIWQSTWFAAFTGLLVFALRRHSARVRHALWLAASLKFLIPFSLLVGLGTQVAPRTATLPVSPEVGVAVEALAEPMPESDAQARRPVPLAALWV